MENGKGCTSSKLSVFGFGTGIGVTWGLGVLLMGLASTYFNFGTPWIELLASIYMGYASTLVGSFIGGGWGLLDGFVAGAVVAIIYNHCIGCCGCPMCKHKHKR